ncbi:MAG: hypothetical protein P9L99_00515 [Candidatus Lernaella stagnicola]|nr:hypothetical protein [Candidatus Lernaella stagnicola]
MQTVRFLMLAAVVFGLLFGFSVIVGCGEEGSAGDDDASHNADDDDSDDDDDSMGTGPTIEYIIGDSPTHQGRIADGVIIKGDNLEGGRIFVYPANLSLAKTHPSMKSIRCECV